MTVMESSKKSDQTPLLDVKNFSLTFRHYEKGLRETELEVIRNINLSVHEGEVVAVLGASGSGKSLVANAILGILPENAVTSGELNYRGKELTRKRQISLRGKEISLIPQSVNALDPLMKTNKQVQSMIAGKNKKKIQKNIFKKVGLSDSTGDLYPFELSGGMARRVLVSTAIVNRANLVIADEPTPGLDPAVLQAMLGQMRQLADDGKGMVFITHDIEVALQVADKIAVFYEGETIEITYAENFSGKGEKLHHPYTKALWNSLPKNQFISSPKSELSSIDKNIKKESAKLKKPSLNIRGISYHYQNNPWLFKKMNLSIMPGEIVGIYGSSGSGKSTMAQIIAGYKRPIEGEVTLGRKMISKSGRYPVQMVWQHPEKAINPRWRMKQTLKEAGEIDQKLFTTLGIKSEWLDRWPSELSGGELQRFCLVRALMGDINYLVADEITTMLDSVTQAQIWHSLIKLVKGRDIGVIAISHDHQLLKKVCDRVILFQDLNE